MIHSFNVKVSWRVKSNADRSSNRKSLKNHVVSNDRLHLNVSAAKSFKGDPSLPNPEDLLLSSIASCHMMSYLYCCQVNQIEILAYEDNAVAELEVLADGSGRISKVILHPCIKLADLSQKEMAEKMHIEANKLCFIANSCNFVVQHHSTFII